MSKNTVTTPEDKSVETSIANLRKTAGDRYIVLGFSSGNALAVSGEGEGGLTEAHNANLFGEDAEKYIYMKKDLQIEKAKTTKFVFIDYTPSGVKPIRRAMLSQLRAQVVALCKPIHVEFSVDTPKDLSDADVNDRVGAASGTKSAVTDKKAEVKHKDDKPTHQSFIPPSSSSSSSSTSMPVTRAKGGSVSTGQPVQSKIPPQNIKWTEGDEEKFKSARSHIHESKDEYPWVVVSYCAKDTLAFVGSGNGVNDLVAALPAQTVFPHYGLVRVNLTDGKSHTTRIVYLSYTNEDIPPLKKADASTKNGAITALLGTHHAKLDFSKPSELDENAIKSAK
jgi:hypothetical protein